MMPRITLVVPMLNEAQTLLDLLCALKAQTRRPDELIFVDAGSSDGSGDLVSEWWASEGWIGLGCRVINLDGAYPGAGRNIGIRAAQGDWIAFIDAGIEPETDWLEQLARCMNLSQMPGVFGVCQFWADKPLQRVICALSNGQGAIQPVVPASLFKKDVFDHVGYFPENLRAAEDLLWVARYEMNFGSRRICEDARVHYHHYPSTWQEAACKWLRAEYFSVLAGVRTRQHLFFLFLFPASIVLLVSASRLGVMLCLAYLVLRGVLDPIRRSRSYLWWRPHANALFIAIPMGAVLDVSKFFGIVLGLIVKSRSRYKIG